MGLGEPGRAVDELEVVVALEPFPAALAPLVDDLALAVAHHTQVHRDPAGLHAVVGGPAGQVGDPGARRHGLCRRATEQHAGTAHAVVPLDDRGFEPRFGQSTRQRLPALTRPDDDGVVSLRLPHCPHTRFPGAQVTLLSYHQANAFAVPAVPARGAVWGRPS